MPDTNDRRTQHWTEQLPERNLNAVLDAVNAGQPFDGILHQEANEEDQDGKPSPESDSR